MAERTIFILLAATLTASVSSLSEADLLSMKNLDFTFSSRLDENGQFKNDWHLNNEGSSLPDNYKVNMKSDVKEVNGNLHYHLHAQVIVPPPIPKDYVTVPHIGHYKFYPGGAISYKQAAATCKYNGAHLAVINSEDEMVALRNIYAKYPDAKGIAWLGFNELTTKGRFLTIFGKTLEETGYSNWYWNQPEGGAKGEHCGSMDRSGYFHDLYCEEHSPWPFFCELNVNEDQFDGQKY